MIGLGVSRLCYCPVLSQIFGEEPNASNDEWKGQQKGKRRGKRENPAIQFSEGFSSFGHIDSPSIIILSGRTLYHKIAAEGGVHGEFVSYADTR